MSLGTQIQPSLSGTLQLSRTNAFFMGGGKALVNAYYRSAEKLGVQIRYDAPVDWLEIKKGRFVAAYVGGDAERDPLVQLAVAHLEFEALHPFADGNGRLGRMIIPLFLFARKLLHGPNFYMSGYLEARREEYVERMRAVSRDG